MHRANQAYNNPKSSMIFFSVMMEITSSACRAMLNELVQENKHGEKQYTLSSEEGSELYPEKDVGNLVFKANGRYDLYAKVCDFLLPEYDLLFKRCKFIQELETLEEEHLDLRGIIKQELSFFSDSESSICGNRFWFNRVHIHGESDEEDSESEVEDD